MVMEGDSNNRPNPRALFGRHILVGPGRPAADDQGNGLHACGRRGLCN
jgi:hypothetical protein